MPLRTQAVTYNSQMRPATITENNYASVFTYNVDGDRLKMVQRKSGVDNLTRYYLGNNQYEIDKGIAGTKERLYIGGNAYSAVAVYVKEGGSWSLNYICRDYLGSITHITDANGKLKQELSYDAWGRLRNPVNQAIYAIDSEPTLLLGRGYTGHEHLTEFGLVNMNARLYDSALGRFLSPDPYVQAPYMSQNFNRYSYALNNPLRYTDESGEFWQFIVGAVVGGVFNVVSNWGNIHNIGDGLAYFGIGAAGGALAALGNPFAIAGAGAFVAGTNSAYSQYQTNGFVNWNQVGMSATIGGATAYLGLQVAKGISPYAEKIFSDQMNPVLRSGLVDATIGASTGGVVGGGLAYAQTGDLNSALNGFGTGFATGAVSGFGVGAGRKVYDHWLNNKHWWTGEIKPPQTQQNTLNTEAAYTHEYKYDPRVRARGVEDPSAHNFPYSFDDQILSTNPKTFDSGYRMFELEGILNGKKGIYQIGVTKDGVINHRTFVRE